MIGLLPCPFCGCELYAEWNRPNPKARCRTEDCKGRQLPVLNLDQPDDIAAWNQRAANTVLADVRDLLSGALIATGPAASIMVADAIKIIDAGTTAGSRAEGIEP